MWVRVNAVIFVNNKKFNSEGRVNRGKTEQQKIWFHLTVSLAVTVLQASSCKNYYNHECLLACYFQTIDTQICPWEISLNIFLYKKKLINMPGRVRSNLERVKIFLSMPVTLPLLCWWGWHERLQKNGWKSW